MDSEAPLVAIVGRPNVGKSALFNRLTRSRRALVEPVAGTTRDRQYGRFDIRGRRIRLVDTGGLGSPDDDPFAGGIRRQVEAGLADADLVLFVLDTSTGVMPPDEEIADMLRRAKQPVLLVANKADRGAAAYGRHELHRLGLGNAVLISAYHDTGTYDLLDEIERLLPPPEAEEPAETEDGEATDAERLPLRIAIVGRPNVGKSSLVNAILGEDRSLVSDIPGTTRDAIDSAFTFEGTEVVLVDTAGIRRRGKIERGVERHSVQQAERALTRADVIFLLIDPDEPTVAQDTHIAGLAADRAKGLVLVVNKWDLVEDRSERAAFARRIDSRYRFAPWAPVHFTSALTGEGVADLLRLAIHIREVRSRRVQTSEVNRVVQRAVTQHPPRYVNQRRLKVLYATQAEADPPTFVFFVNDPELLHFAYRRFLENRIREAFDFQGTAIRMRFRSRTPEEARVPV